MRASGTVIPFDRAADIVRSAAGPLAREEVPLAEALGRAMPEEVRARFDSPPFDRSAMDGFAVRSGESARELRITGTVAAGALPPRIGPGECARIMTGAMLPEGTGRVIRLEYVRETGDRIEVFREETQSNVIRRGEGHRAGDVVLAPRILEPQDLGILASLGLERVAVSRRPTVAVLATGSELREQGNGLDDAAIYDSNGPQICAQVRSCGCEPRSLGRVADDLARIEERIGAAAGSDLLIVSGGVSKGAFDFVPEALSRAGFETLLHGVAVRPGMPTLFARRGAMCAFGLPGNTVSTFVIFEVLVRPLLRLMLRLPAEAEAVRGELDAPIRRRQTERLEFLPVRVDRGRVHPVPYRGSSHLSALASANGLLRIEAGVESLPEGTAVDVKLVRGRE